jgi:hypothetical protein
MTNGSESIAQSMPVSGGCGVMLKLSSRTKSVIVSEAPSVAMLIAFWRCASFDGSQRGSTSAF